MVLGIHPTGSGSGPLAAGREALTLPSFPPPSGVKAWSAGVGVPLRLCNRPHYTQVFRDGQAFSFLVYTEALGPQTGACVLLYAGSEIQTQAFMKHFTR